MHVINIVTSWSRSPVDFVMSTYYDLVVSDPCRDITIQFLECSVVVEKTILQQEFIMNPYLQVDIPKLHEKACNCLLKVASMVTGHAQ